MTLCSPGTTNDKSCGEENEEGGDIGGDDRRTHGRIPEQRREDAKQRADDRDDGRSDRDAFEGAEHAHRR